MVVEITLSGIIVLGFFIIIVLLIIKGVKLRVEIEDQEDYIVFLRTTLEEQSDLVRKQNAFLVALERELEEVKNNDL